MTTKRTPAPKPETPVTVNLPVPLPAEPAPSPNFEDEAKAAAAYANHLEGELNSARADVEVLESEVLRLHRLIADTSTDTVVRKASERFLSAR